MCLNWKLLFVLMSKESAASPVSTASCPIMELSLLTLAVVATQRRETKLFCPRPRSHFTRHQHAMARVPRILCACSLTRHVPHRIIYGNTDRKPFDIKLLVFRRKSLRNFLFYTRRKNYFHIRLPCFCRRALSELFLTLLRCCRCSVCPVSA